MIITKIMTMHRICIHGPHTQIYRCPRFILNSERNRCQAGAIAKAMGHRTIVNAPAGSVIKYVVTDGSGSEVSSCFIGPVIELAKGEANIENRVNTRFITKKNCIIRNPNHCIMEIKIHLGSV